jgi:hypothetical protein
LAVISSIRRRGILLLLVTLPDGTRSLIPAAWTNWDSAEQTNGELLTNVVGASDTIAAVSDLLQARIVIDALLNRLAESARQKESSDAIEVGVSRSNKSTAATSDQSMEPDRSGSPRRSARYPLASYRPHACGQAGEGHDQ